MGPGFGGAVAVHWVRPSLGSRPLAAPSRRLGASRPQRRHAGGRAPARGLTRMEPGEIPDEPEEARACANHGHGKPENEHASKSQ